MNAARSHGIKRLALIVLGGAAGVAVGLAGEIRIWRLTGNAAVDAACQGAVGKPPSHGATGRGEVAAVVVAATPKLLPLLTFEDGAGAKKSLAEWGGRTVLFNLWATWCVCPCRREKCPRWMPCKAGWAGPDSRVVSVNIDTREPEKPRRG